ncbi:tetraspanin-1-like [Mytilus galloprovincialis]|uniref:tetraspanin-1-like n=1 Tax=Mytilus galloprovincialis TaxID=29158 RepID=UPI003F7B9D12
MAEYSCGQNLARLFLVIFNLIFVIVGLALIVVGGLLKAGAEFLDVLGSFVKEIPGLGNIAIAIIAFGVVIFLIGIFGTCGSCCSVRCMLILYAVLVMIITLAEVVIVALLFSGTLDKTVTKGFSNLTKKYKMPADIAKIDADDIVSRLIDAVFISLKCCDYENIVGATSNKIPPSCCKGLSRKVLESGDLTAIQACNNSPSDANSYINKRCGVALIDMMRDNQAYVIGIGVALLVIELLCIFFSLWICSQINKKNRVSSI